MADIVGVAATAAQLATTCFSLLDKINKIKGGSSTLEKYSQQLKELSKLSDSVSNNPLLQTPDIALQTQAILSIIEESCFDSLLNKRRFLRTLGFLYHEKHILDVLKVLESRKATLLLVIEDIQSQTLHDIQQGISIMANRSSHSGRKPSRKSSRKTRSGHESETGARGLSARDSSSKPYMTKSETSEDDKNIINVLPDALTRRPSSKAENFSGISPDSFPQQSHSQRRVYSGISAGRRVTQVNGSFIHMPDRMNGDPLKAVLGNPTYNDVEKYGEGAQINGPVWIQRTDEYAPEIPDFAGSWNNITFDKSPCGDSATTHNSSDQKNTKRKKSKKEKGKKEKSKKEKNNKEKNRKMMQINGGVMLRENKQLFSGFDLSR